jgi:hypothetical protein
MKDDASRETPPRRGPNGRLSLVALLFLLPAIPLIFLGYGSDYDIYAVLDAGASTWRDWEPRMSRNPGYWLHEAFVYAVGGIGGSVLVNACTLAASLLLIQRFWAICGDLGIESRVPLTLCLAWNPWYLVASTSAIDTIWAALFIVLSVEAVARERAFVAGFWGGIAVASRLGSAFTVAGAVVWTVLRNLSSRAVLHGATVGLLMCAIALVFYLPSWIVSGRSFSFLSAHVGDEQLWTFVAHLGRVVYKPLYLLGMAGNVVVLAIVVLNRRRLFDVLADKRGIAVAGAGAVMGNLVLFAMYPIELSYLIPALPFILLLIGLLLAGASAWQPWMLVAATASYWVVSIPLATPNVPGAASDATIGVRLEQGVLLDDIRDRLQLRGCHSHECYKERRR